MSANANITMPDADVNGYFGLLTAFYFSGSATDTVIETADVDNWVDVNFLPHDTGSAEGIYDQRSQIMKDAIADPYDELTGILSLEGLEVTDYGFFRAGFSFNPDVDGGTIKARLLFNRHSQATPSTDFEISTTALNMNDGASIDYLAEPFLSFFIGDTIDTVGQGDSGKCRFQICSNVEGTLSMRELTWFFSRGKA